MIIGLYSKTMKTTKLLIGLILVATAIMIAKPVFAWNLQGSCAGLPAEVNIGETVVWTTNQTSTAQTGDGAYYTWQWSGNESLSGSTQSVSKTYATAGIKNASVKISLVITPSKIEKITRTCSITVKTPPATEPPPEQPPVNPPPENPPPTNPPPANPPSSGCQSNCGGGGLNQPNVVLLQKAIKTPLAFVYLSQIPYTGLSGTGKILLFILGLAVWSALVVYTLRSQKTAELAGRLISNVRARFSLTTSKIFQLAEKPMDNFEMRESAPISEMESLLAVEAKKERTLISPDGLKTVIETATAKNEKPIVVLGKTMENAKNKFPREDGWLLLNKEKIEASLPTETVAVPAYGASEKVTTEINTFVSLLSRGDEKAVTDHLRVLRTEGKSVERFIRETIMALDDAYRARLENENDRHNFVLSQIISRWSSEKTEEVIGILLSIINKNYKNPAIGLKLAVMRIGELKE
ncbi:MAG: hypothetical protein UW71_C0013G0012 [Parcubacteria group bacterium GW2011_GWB1_44_7]|nr:MAG: hypothetical protein UW71_C0013G0012 [Parcubacteria group bacterium GW2011_GWB1_44_7]